MADLTATVIGADGRMGREHVAAYKACGVEVLSQDDFKEGVFSIACPDEYHGTYVGFGLVNGDHVFCENPLYTTRKDGFRIKNVLGGTPKPLHLAQNFPLRYADCFENLKREDFGEIYRIEANYNWGRTHKLNEGWRRHDPNYSLVMGGLIHMVDLIVWITGLDMEVISAIGVNKSAPEFIGYDTVTA